MAQPNGAQEFGEMRVCVVRTRCRFRVVLDREYGKGSVPNPFYAAVIEVEVGDLKFRCTWDAARIAHDRESVVLRRDEHVA